MCVSNLSGGVRLGTYVIPTEEELRERVAELELQVEHEREAS